MEFKFNPITGKLDIVADPAGSDGNLIWNNAGAYAGALNSTVDSSGNITLGARLTNSVAAALSAPPVSVTGTWITTGGTATTTKPTVVIEPTGTTSTGWSTAGTGLGVNAPSGFTGRLLDLQLNGTSQFSVSSVGVLTASSLAGVGTAGAITTTGLTMTTARLLGRSTASTGAIEELTLPTGFDLSGGALRAPAEIGIACSDESTALTTGTGKTTFRMPYAMTLTAVRLSVSTAPTGSAIVVNIKESGVTVFSTKPQIDAGSTTSVGSGTAAVISDSALADNAQITVDIDQIGSTVAGAGLKVWLIGRRA